MTALQRELAYSSTSETENKFDLASALLSNVGDHAHGTLQLVSTHAATAGGGHTLVLWAALQDRVLTAVEATTTADLDQPATRIIAFRAAGLMFAGRANDTFAAHGRHIYILAATVGADTWQLTVDDVTAARRTDLATALDIIADPHETATAAG